MSEPFKKAMNDISDTLKEAYNCKHAVVIPGSGTYAMEACARQFATGKKAVVLRNGFFSYRWTQIFEACGIPSEHTVLRAKPINPERADPPAAVRAVPDRGCDRDDRSARSRASSSRRTSRPSTGMILPDDYINRSPTRSASPPARPTWRAALCLSSLHRFVAPLGSTWRRWGVDALISAPQKGWTGPACAGLVMLSERGADVTRATRGSSFVCDLRKWLELMDSYEAGGFMYHATMPTDALITFRDVMLETKDFGFERRARVAGQHPRGAGRHCAQDDVQREGHRRKMVRVAAPGFQAPGVVVVHHSDAAVPGKFIKAARRLRPACPL